VAQRLDQQLAVDRGLRIELRRIGPRGKVGIAAVREDAAGGRVAKKSLGPLAEVPLAAANQGLGVGGQPGVIDGHMVGDQIEDKSNPARLQPSP
jgi:hypothetical protein